MAAVEQDLGVLFQADVVKSFIMKRSSLFILATAVVLWSNVANVPAFGQSYDLRGPWVGKAQGTIFGAEGSVTITQQQGEDLEGIVEGGNWLGKAKFNIMGKFRQNYIFGEKEGNTFQGYLYGDGTIRGLVKAIDGGTYQIFLRRPYPQWGMPQWGGMPPGGMWQSN
jgi:hypothetical protein